MDKSKAVAGAYELTIYGLIRQIHEELIESERIRTRQGLQPLFVVEELELEVHFTVHQTKKKGGKIDAKLVVLDGSVDETKKTTHTMRLKLRVPDQSSSPELSSQSIIGALPSSESS